MNKIDVNNLKTIRDALEIIGIDKRVITSPALEFIVSDLIGKKLNFDVLNNAIAIVDDDRLITISTTSGQYTRTDEYISSDMRYKKYMRQIVQSDVQNIVSYKVTGYVQTIPTIGKNAIVSTLEENVYDENGLEQRKLKAKSDVKTTDKSIFELKNQEILFPFGVSDRYFHDEIEMERVMGDLIDYTVRSSGKFLCRSFIKNSSKDIRLLDFGEGIYSYDDLTKPIPYLTQEEIDEYLKDLPLNISKVLEKDLHMRKKNTKKTTSKELVKNPENLVSRILNI